MSITYPDAQPSSASMAANKPAGGGIMNSGSALFPTGAAQVYERAAKARTSRNMRLAWIAAPIAVVLIGGAVYLSASHQPITARAIAPVPPALAVQPAVPAADATRHVVTQTRIVQAPAAPVASTEQVEPARTAATPVHGVRTRVTRSEAAPAQTAPVEAAPIQAPAAAPAISAPAQAATPAATPGTFTLTPAPEAAPAATSSMAPATPDTAPAASAPAAPSVAQPQ